MMASRSKKRKALQAYNTMKQVSKPMTIMDARSPGRNADRRGAGTARA